MAAKKKSAAKKKAATKRKSAATRKSATVVQRPKTGTAITREFKGAKHTVKVTADGYSYKGAEYGSLTAIAKVITGYASISGPRFFAADQTSKNGGGA